MYFIPKIVCLFESPTAMSGLVCHVPDVLFQGSCWAGPHSSRIRSRAIRKMELGEGRWSPTRRCRHPRPHLHSRPHPIVLRQPLPSAIDDPPAAPFLPFPLSVAPAYGRCWGGGRRGAECGIRNPPIRRCTGEGAPNRVHSCDFDLANVSCFVSPPSSGDVHLKERFFLLYILLLKVSMVLLRASLTFRNPQVFQEPRRP